MEAGALFLFALPHSSLGWEFGPVRELGAAPNVLRFQVDYCAWGATSRRRTTVLTNYPSFRGLAARCSCQGEHKTAETENTEDGMPLVPVPPKMCSQIAKLVREGVESGCVELAARLGETPKPAKPHFHEAGVLWREEARWALTFRGTWEREEAISVLEMRTATLLARHLSRSGANWGRRFLVLLDSISALGACMKGRSSSPPMLAGCRTLLAVHLSTGIRLLGRWCPSEWNFADGPSRGGPVGVAAETLEKGRAPE